MADDHDAPDDHDPHTELMVAAAAVTAALSPPLGFALAAGAALRSPRVRGAIRQGTVRAVAGAMQAGEQLSSVVAERSGSHTDDEDATPSSPARVG